MEAMEAPAFNWVKARSQCSLKGVFVLLREVIEADVEAANALNRRGLEFRVTQVAEGRIAVTRKRDLGGFTEDMTVVFSLSSEGITARTAPTHGTPVVLFTATPSLNRDGDCLLEVKGEAKGEPCRLWQISRRALEPLFFAEGLDD